VSFTTGPLLGLGDRLGSTTSLCVGKEIGAEVAIGAGVCAGVGVDATGVCAGAGAGAWHNTSCDNIAHAPHCAIENILFRRRKEVNRVVNIKAVMNRILLKNALHHKNNF